MDIEYFQSVLPPSFQSSLPSRDWVSDVSIGRQGILSASYDGSATLWSLNSEQIAKASHDLPVLSACISQNHLISGGMDRRIQIQSLNHDSAQYSFEYHQAPVSTLRANPHAAEHASFLSGSWDGGIALWSTNPDFETKQTQSSTSSGPAKKRRKMPDTSLKGLRPVHALSPSNPTTSATVCRAIFDKTNAARAWSAGADHAVRSWDLELGIAVQSRVSGLREFFPTLSCSW